MMQKPIGGLLPPSTTAGLRFAYTMYKPVVILYDYQSIRRRKKLTNLKRLTIQSISVHMCTRLLEIY